MNALVCQGLRAAYGRGPDVLAGIGLEIEPGEVIGLVGKNGAGKTTLMRIAMGMLAPRAGEIRVFGLDPRRDAVAVKQRVGYVPEKQTLPSFLSVAQIVDLHRAVYPSWDDRMAHELLDELELDPRRKVRTLSKGQARRLALICAVAHRPELLLLDEPASGLDPAARREFLQTSIRLLNETGTTILFSSHYMTDVERMAERIVMLHEGAVILDDGLLALQEGFSLALIPGGAGVGLERLRVLGDCVSARQLADGLHAVLRLDADAARRAFVQDLGVEHVQCRPISLEDMFVEISGARR